MELGTSLSPVRHLHSCHTFDQNHHLNLCLPTSCLLYWGNYVLHSSPPSNLNTVEGYNIEEEKSECSFLPQSHLYTRWHWWQFVGIRTYSDQSFLSKSEPATIFKVTIYEHIGIMDDSLGHFWVIPDGVTIHSIVHTFWFLFQLWVFVIACIAHSPSTFITTSKGITLNFLTYAAGSQNMSVSISGCYVLFLKAYSPSPSHSTFAAHFCWAIMVIGPWEEWRAPLNRFAPHPYPRALCYACIARVLQDFSSLCTAILWSTYTLCCTPCYACMCTSSSVIPSLTTVCWGASLSVPLAILCRSHCPALCRQ